MTVLERLDSALLEQQILLTKIQQEIAEITALKLETAELMEVAKRVASRVLGNAIVATLKDDLLALFDGDNGSGNGHGVSEPPNRELTDDERQVVEEEYQKGKDWLTAEVSQEIGQTTAEVSREIAAQIGVSQEPPIEEKYSEALNEPNENDKSDWPDDEDANNDALAQAELAAEKKNTLTPATESQPFIDSPTDSYIRLVFLSPTVAYQRKFDGEIICGYLACRSQALAKEWAEFLELRDQCRCEVRKAKRMVRRPVYSDWEVKIKNCRIEVLEKLAKSHDSEKPPLEFQSGDLVQVNFPESRLNKKKGVLRGGEGNHWLIEIGDESFSITKDKISLIKPHFEPQVGDLVFLDSDPARHPWKVEEVGTQFLQMVNTSTGDLKVGVTPSQISLLDRPSQQSPKYFAPIEVVNERLLVDIGESGDKFYFGFKTVADQRSFDLWLRHSTLPFEKAASHSANYQFDCWPWKYTVEVECDLSTALQILTYFEETPGAAAWRESVKKPLVATKYRSQDDYKYQVKRNLDAALATDDFSEAECKFTGLCGVPGVFQVAIYEKDNPFDPLKIWKIGQAIA